MEHLLETEEGGEGQPLVCVCGGGAQALAFFPSRAANDCWNCQASRLTLWASEA